MRNIETFLEQSKKALEAHDGRVNLQTGVQFFTNKEGFITGYELMYDNFVHSSPEEKAIVSRHSEWLHLNAKMWKTLYNDSLKVYKEKTKNPKILQLKNEGFSVYNVLEFKPEQCQSKKQETA